MMQEKQLSLVDQSVMINTLLSAKDVVLTTHTNPDGDALGSECALYHFLRQREIPCRIVNCDPVPENLTLLDGDGIFETWDEGRHADLVMNADCLVALDFNQPGRVRGMETALLESKATRVVIDHHMNPRPFAAHYLSVTDASSTAEIVHDLIETAGGTITQEIALGLYVGIVTDTGSFRFDRTTPRVHHIAATLLERGVDPSTVFRRIYDDYPIGRTQLIGRILSGIDQYCGGRATIFSVTRRMLEETGTGVDDVENVVNYGLSIRGVELTALITETDDGCKVSFRSRGRYSVNDIAGGFGGGGHRMAAGARVEGGDVSSLRSRIRDVFCQVLENPDAGDGENANTPTC
jgi:phosphoesterase RecJ-like protein